MYKRQDQPIKLITDYFLSIGQKAWWLADSTPAAIQMFGKLPKVEQNKLMGYAFAHFAEIFSNSGTKFYRYMSWLASENSIIDPALRDRFTAGGDVYKRQDKYYYLRPVGGASTTTLYVKTTNIRKNMRSILREGKAEELLRRSGSGASIYNRDSRIRMKEYTDILYSCDLSLIHI